MKKESLNRKDKKGIPQPEGQRKIWTVKYFGTHGIYFLCRSSISHVDDEVVIKLTYNY